MFKSIAVQRRTSNMIGSFSVVYFLFFLTFYIDQINHILIVNVLSIIIANLLFLQFLIE